ncbi:MAG: glycoside hydrolase family 88 protein [Bacteroidales bacterium]|nr:glycoside hydrolase family 88 protein [Bacteroidales bacterium]
MKDHIKKILLVLFFLSMIQLAAESQSTRPLSVRMAESIVQRHPDHYGSWNYETGTVLKGFEDLWRFTDEVKYYNYIKSTVDYVVNNDGIISGYKMSDYNIDQVKEGCSVLLIYKQTGENKYKVAADTLRSQLNKHPRTSEGGFYHKLRYPKQMWLDGLYMGEPFYCEYGKIMNEPANYDDVALQLKLMEKHARDETTGLLYHGWDEDRVQYWADPVTGTSPVFWGRALGWYAMALVDVLDHFPEEHADRDSIIQIFQRLAPAIKDFQDPVSKVWWQVIDSINSSGNWKESSASCMFVYALAKGVRMQYLDSSYLEVAKNGYGGIINEFITYNSDSSVNLLNTCEGTGVGGSYDFYAGRGRRINDPKGTGPFIMAGVEIEKAGLLVPPDRFILDSLNKDAVFLSWQDHSSNETGFIIEKNSGQGFEFLADLESNVTHYQDSAIIEGTIYEYRISTYHSNDTSIFSNILSVVSAPTGASGYTPAHNSTDISTGVSLMWQPGRIVNSHNVYFGKTNPPAFVKNTADTIYNPGTLDGNTMYYWRIDEVNENYITTGEVLSFTTEEVQSGFNSPSETDKLVNVYPNPAKDVLYIAMNSPYESKALIEVIDLLGNRVITAKTGGLITGLDLRSLTQGIYFIRIESAVSDKVFTMRFAKTGDKR